MNYFKIDRSGNYLRRRQYIFHYTRVNFNYTSKPKSFLSKLRLLLDKGVLQIGRYFNKVYVPMILTMILQHICFIAI